jgi:hypothetical protein
MKNFKPVILDGVIVPDYWVSPEGDIWSTKAKKPKALKSHCAKKNYPQIVLSINGKTTSQLVHKLVCLAYHKFTKPDDVTKADWLVTPNSVKKLVQSLYQVNHKDHDHHNHHPSNLEWVTVKQNSKKYQEHRERKLA